MRKWMILIVVVSLATVLAAFLLLRKPQEARSLQQDTFKSSSQAELARERQSSHKTQVDDEKLAPDEIARWKQFDEWKQKNDIVAAMEPLKRVNDAARKRGDLTSDEVQELARYMGSELFFLRHVATSIAANASSTETRAALRPIIVKMLSDPVPEVRLEAVYTLRVVGDEAVLPYLQHLRSDPDPEIAREAGKTLIKLSKPATMQH